MRTIKKRKGLFDPRHQRLMGRKNVRGRRDGKEGK